MKMIDRLVPFRDAATYLGIGVRTLERMIDAGIVPVPVKVGVKRVYPESVLADIIERAKRGDLCR